MKFSIISLMLFTLWVALAIQVGFSWFRVAEFSKQKTIFEQQARGYVSKYSGRVWKYDQRVPELETDLSQLVSLQKELGKVFEGEVPALSVITPQENTISLRRIPLFAPNLGEWKLKIHIPPSRKLSLGVELEAVGDDETAALEEVQWKPKRSVLHTLAPGTHVVHWKHSYQKDSATFGVHIDAKEIVRFSWASSQNGYSFSGPSLQQQKDCPPGESFRRMEYQIEPRSNQTRVLISLSEPE